MTRLLKQEEKLDADEEKAEEELIRLQSQLSEAVGRLARIRRIRRQVKAKSQEAFQRGMAQADEEDGVVNALNAHEHWVVDDIQALGAPNDANWAEFGLGEEFSDVGPLVGDTLQVAAGSSSNLT